MGRELGRRREVGSVLRGEFSEKMCNRYIILVFVILVGLFFRFFRKYFFFGY